MGRWLPPLRGTVPPTESQQRCVMFVCVELEGEIRPIGTAFLVGVLVGSDVPRWVTYLVTAKHVVAHGQPTYVRLRRVDGGPPVDQPLETWVQHPTTDVAITPCVVAWGEYIAGFQRITTQRNRPYSFYVPTVGQPAHFVGLLADVPSMVKRAIPMMRSAMIGALYADEIPVRYKDARGIIQFDDVPQAHLIDTFSRSGFSGSPVFADYPSARHTVFSTGDGVERLSEPTFASDLLGVLVGHFGRGEENTGVAIVVPMEALLELLEDPRLVEFREREAARMEKRRKDEEAENAAVLDSLGPPAPSDDEDRVSLDGVNPEDALRALLRTPPHGRTQDPA